MSVLNVSLLGSTALIAVDTHVERADGSVEERSKLNIIPHTRLVIAGRGLSDVARNCFWNCLNAAPTFDRATAYMAQVLPVVMQEQAAIAEQQGIPKHKIAEQQVTLIGPGYRGMRAMNYLTNDGETFTSELIESNQDFAGQVSETGIAAPTMELTSESRFPRTVAEMAALCRRQVRFMQDGGSNASGGRILVVELTSHGYSQQSFELTA